MRAIIISVFAMAILPLVSFTSCSLQLKNPPAPPAHPLAGFWVGAETFEDEDSSARTVLWIERYAGDEVPYRFTLVHLVHRDLLVSGKTVFVEERSGQLLTSGPEVLFQQENYRASSRKNTEKKAGRVWPIAAYRPEVLDRELRGGRKLALLKLAADGRSMTDGDWTFRRVLDPASGGALNVHAGGVILRASKDGRRAQLWSFIGGMRKPGAEFDYFRDGKKVGRLRIDGTRKSWQNKWLESTSLALDGSVRMGDAVVAAGSLEKFIKRTRLTREQILKKIQRGEKVSKQDLIRALKKNQP